MKSDLAPIHRLLFAPPLFILFLMTILQKILKNHYGFTLVETLLAIGISTGAALIVYKVLGESQKGQIMVENRDDINQIHREIIGKFTDRSICSQTLKEGMSKDLPEFSLSKIVNDKETIILSIPFQMGKITLKNLDVVAVDKLKNQAEILAVYSHTIASKPITSQKRFRLELSFKDGQFESCVTRGSLGLDPKDACDLVVGSDALGASYFYNGKCNFAKGACEQSGRVWNEELVKCNFSADDIEALRKEICSTLGFEYSPQTSQCLPGKVLMDAVEEYTKKSQGQK